MFKKSIFILVLLTAGVLALFAGGQQNSTVTGPALPAQSGPVTYPVTGNPRITYSRIPDADFFNSGFTSLNDSPVIKAWIKQTGINVDIIQLADEAAYMLYLAAGTPPDIVQVWKGFYGGIGKMHEDGLAQDLTDLLPVYAPDYWALINSDDQYMIPIREPDGRHYAVAGYLQEIPGFNASWFGLVARKEFLDKLNMTAPETPNEFYTYLKGLKDELRIETPFMFGSNRLDNLFNQGALPSGFGLPSAGFYQLNGRVHFGAYDPQYRELLAFMNRLFSEGLLDNNFAVTDDNTTYSSVVNGKTGLTAFGSATFPNLANAANNAPDFNLMGLSSMTTAKGVKPMWSLTDLPVTTSYWCFLPDRCRDAANSLKLLNYLHTKEGHILGNFGEENVTFTYENGQPVFTQFVMNNPRGIALNAVMHAYTLIGFPIMQDNRMSRQRMGSQMQIQATEAWSNSDIAKYRIINSSILAQYADEYAGLVTDINTFVRESRAQFISGALPVDRYESYYIPALKNMGMDRLIQIAQESFNFYNK